METIFDKHRIHDCIKALLDEQIQISHQLTTYNGSDSKHVASSKLLSKELTVVISLLSAYRKLDVIKYSLSDINANKDLTDTVKKGLGLVRVAIFKAAYLILLPAKS